MKATTKVEITQKSKDIFEPGNLVIVPSSSNIAPVLVVNSSRDLLQDYFWGVSVSFDDGAKPYVMPLQKANYIQFIGTVSLTTKE